MTIASTADVSDFALDAAGLADDSVSETQDTVNAISL